MSSRGASRRGISWPPEALGASAGALIRNAPAASAGVLLLAGMAMLLAACAGSGPKVSTTVLAPAPATPASDYYVEKTEVRSRDTGDEAWQRNEQYAKALAQQLRDALQGAGKNIAPPPAMIVRSRLYLAWQDPPSKGGVAQGDKARVEILLQVVDPDTRAVRYSTLTKSDIAPPKIVGYAYGDDRAANVQKALDQAVADFISRL